jgi:hypothetical protein
VGSVFVALAVVFLAITFQDYLRAEGKLTPARRTWLRVAWIFAAVGIAVNFVSVIWR